MPKTHVTVAEAVILTGKSKSAIYRLTSTGEVRTRDTTNGIEINIDSLHRAIARTRRGRPPGTSKHAA